MINCKFNNERICSFDIGDFLNRNKTLENEWRKAGKNKELICIECKEPVILKAGNIVSPYFAHSNSTTRPDCIFRTKPVNHTKNRAMQLIYYYFTMFDIGEVYFNYRVSNKLITDMYLKKINLHYKLLNLRRRNKINDIIKEYKKINIDNLRFLYYSKSDNIVEEFSHIRIFCFFKNIFDEHGSDLIWKNNKIVTIIDVKNEKLYCLDTLSFSECKYKEYDISSNNDSYLLIVKDFNQSLKDNKVSTINWTGK